MFAALLKSRAPEPAVIPVAPPDPLTRSFVVANAENAGRAIALAMWECRGGTYVSDTGWADPAGENCYRVTVRLRHRDEPAMISGSHDELHVRRLHAYNAAHGGQSN